MCVECIVWGLLDRQRLLLVIALISLCFVFTEWCAPRAVGVVQCVCVCVCACVCVCSSKGRSSLCVLTTNDRNLLPCLPAASSFIVSRFMFVYPTSHRSSCRG